MAFLGEILNARDMASFDEFRDALILADGKISTLKTELSRALHSCFSVFDADIDRVSSWLEECVAIQEEAVRLKEQLDKNKHTSALSAEEFNSLNEELDDCKENISVVSALIEIVQNLEVADPEGDYHMSSKRLKKCEEDLATIVKDFHTDEDIAWIKGLQAAIADRVLGTYEVAMKEWNAKFHFEKNSLVVNPYRGDINNLMEALQNIGYFKNVWERFCKQFWQELLSKASTPDYSVEFTQPTPNQMRRRSMAVKRDVIPVRDTDPDVDGLSDLGSGEQSVCTLYVTRMKKLDTPLRTAGLVFQNVIKLIGSLSEMFEAKPETMQELGDMLGSQLVHVLNTKCLKTLILQQSDGDQDKAKADVSSLKEFREKLSEFNFRLPDESLLDEFETNFDALYMNQFRQNRLGEIRKLIRSDIHQTVLFVPEAEKMIKSENGSGDEVDILHRNAFAGQKYTISKSIAEMVEILRDHFDNYPGDAELIANSLNLFISIVVVPKHESDAKDFIPLSAVLIHNNCWYLCHHVEVSFPFNEDKIPMLRTKAAHAYAFMMRSVRTKLNCMISSAMTGLNEEVESMKDNISSKFLEISAELHRFNKMFFEVLPPGVLSQTLATLLDHIVNEMCSKVLSWEDISANSANQLAACFVKFAEATSSLFKKDAVSVREIDALTSKVVHKWQRFRLLTFILTASMKEIEDKWVNGCGPLSFEFTAEEIRKLVRALFQNTDRRAAFLASIK